MKTFQSPRGFFRRNCASTSSTCTHIGISDDLGDEVSDTVASLLLLEQWETELNACYDGHPRHPVFVALAETVRKFEIPKHEFVDLLTAFRQDQEVGRYE